MRTSILSLMTWRYTVCFIAVALGAPAGCAWSRKAALDVVDPELRAKGEPLARTESKGSGVRLGSYEVSAPNLAREEAGTEGLLPATSAPRPVVQHRLDLDLSATTTGRAWAVECVTQRRQPASMDYAAALDENRDEIAFQCTLVGSDSGQSLDWAFRAEAELSHNFAARLSRPGIDRQLSVEVVVWVERFGRIQRHLPIPVVQVRDGKTTVAAMVLDEPEQAWVSRTVEPEIAEVAMSAMFAIHYLPLGLR